MSELSLARSTDEAPPEAARGLAACTLAEAERRDRQGPSWLEAQRDAAMMHLSRHGFPLPTEEEWRFTPIRSVLRVPYERRDLTAAAGVVDAFAEPRTIVLVNGSIVKDTASSDELQVL